jgi:amidase
MVMPVQPPDRAALAKVAEHYRLGLVDADLESFGAMVHGLLASWDAVEELYARSAPTAPTNRPWTRPDEADNPLNAWYVTTDITEPEAAGGPLSGRTVAIKDNTAVAWLPMMNGSATLEGFVPIRDATVVTRAPHPRGQALLRSRARHLLPPPLAAPTTTSISPGAAAALRCSRVDR